MRVLCAPPHWEAAEVQEWGPEKIEDSLDEQRIVCLSFNRWGTLLAGGTVDGKVLLWDWETRGLAKKFVALQDVPVHLDHDNMPVKITAVEFSRDGSKLMSCAYAPEAKAAHIVVWSVAGGIGTVYSNLEIETGSMPLSTVSLEPMHGSSAVVSCFNAPPLLYDLSQAAPQPEPLPVCNLVAPTEVECKGCAAFAPGGGVIAVGSNKGTLSLAWRDGKTNTWMAFDAATLAKPESAQAVEFLRFSRTGRRLLAKTTDRCIWVLEVQLPPEAARPGMAAALAQAGHGAAHTLGESAHGAGRGALSLLSRLEVDLAPMRVDWKTACFSHYRGGAGTEPSHVCAVYKSETEHRLYVFEAATGRLARVLDGPKPEGVKDAAWHPWAPEVACCSTGKGRVWVWAPVRQEHWSAFAPGFMELRYNEEYVESEDEFDLPMGGEGEGAGDAQEGRVVRKRRQDVSDDESIDVATARTAAVFPSDGEEEEAQCVLHAPVIIPQDESLRPKAAEGAADGEGDGGPSASAPGGGDGGVDPDSFGKGRRKRKAPEAMRQYEDPNNVDQLKTTTPYPKQNYPMRGPGRPPKGF